MFEVPEAKDERDCSQDARWQRRVWASESRIYVATLQRNLFNEWVVVRHWSGKLKRGGQTRTDYVASYAEGCDFLAAIGLRRIQRGYVQQTVEGEPPAEA